MHDTSETIQKRWQARSATVLNSSPCATSPHPATGKIHGLTEDSEGAGTQRPTRQCSHRPSSGRGLPVTCASQCIANTQQQGAALLKALIIDAGISVSVNAGVAQAAEHSPTNQTLPKMVRLSLALTMTSVFDGHVTWSSMVSERVSSRLAGERSDQTEPRIFRTTLTRQPQALP
jgi:hypothetical protein